MFRRYCLPWIVYVVYRCWSLTWRTVIHESPGMQEARSQGGPFIYAHWHRDELGVVQCVGRFRIATMTSLSKDGQLIDFVIRHLGGATSKGSSSKGGSGALRGLVRLMTREGYSASVAVDGPKGPIFRAKPGVFELGKLTDAWIAPVGVASQRRHVFSRAWNRARLPLPFSRVVIWVGEPMRVADFGDADLRGRQIAQVLEKRITASCREAATLGRELAGCRCRDLGGFVEEESPEGVATLAPS